VPFGGAEEVGVLRFGDPVVNALVVPVVAPRWVLAGDAEDELIERLIRASRKAIYWLRSSN
jgi:hypothetical protein